MQGLDVPFPYSEYEILNGMKTFNLIYPYEHPLAQYIKINMVVRAIAFDDDEYQGLLNNEFNPQDVTPIAGKYLEIGYIRETSIRHVAKFEWDLNYGPGSPNAFLKMMNTNSADVYVKVLSLKAPNYSLTTFNKRYGSRVG